MRLCSSGTIVTPKPVANVQLTMNSNISKSAGRLLTGTLLIAALMSAIFIAPDASAQQNYTYRIGNTRVQAGSGLARPSDTYISRGTLSPSAQVPVLGSPPQNTTYYNGAPQQQAGLPGLPSARMGSTVGMPGDYMRSDLNPNVSFQKQQQQRQTRNYIIMQQQPRQQINPYVNGNRPATYGGAAAAQPGSSANMDSSGAASYSSAGGSSYKGY